MLAVRSPRFLEHIPRSLRVSRTALLTLSRDSAPRRPQPCCFANIPLASPTPEALCSCSDYLECSFPMLPVPALDPETLRSLPAEMQAAHWFIACCSEGEHSLGHCGGFRRGVVRKGRAGLFLSGSITTTEWPCLRLMSCEIAYILQERTLPSREGHPDVDNRDCFLVSGFRVENRNCVCARACVW